MRVDLFDCGLPPELIAQHPLRPRDAARLPVVGAALENRRVRDLIRVRTYTQSLDRRSAPASVRPVALRSTRPTQPTKGLPVIC